MNCPKCNKEMKIICKFNELHLYNGTNRVEVLGRCDPCDFDATWTIETSLYGQVEEYNFERYFFG